LARSYDVKKYFVITPLEDQQRFGERLVKHWLVGYGARYNRHRKEAIELIHITSSLDQSIDIIMDMEGERPVLLATDAAERDAKTMTYNDATTLLHSEKVVFLLFGTAWGLHKDILDRADFILDPIQGKSHYNHLSVRTAAGIILDRLAGRWV
jgi:hypothetical protein